MDCFSSRALDRQGRALVRRTKPARCLGAHPPPGLGLCAQQERRGPLHGCGVGLLLWPDTSSHPVSLCCHGDRVQGQGGPPRSRNGDRGSVSGSFQERGHRRLGGVGTAWHGGEGRDSRSLQGEKRGMCSRARPVSRSSGCTPGRGPLRERPERGHSGEAAFWLPAPLRSGESQPCHGALERWEASSHDPASLHPLRTGPAKLPWPETASPTSPSGDPPQDPGPHVRGWRGCAGSLLGLSGSVTK